MARRLVDNATYASNTTTTYDFHFPTKFIPKNFAVCMNLGAAATGDRIITISFAPLIWAYVAASSAYAWVEGTSYTTIVATTTTQAAGCTFTSKPDTYGKPQCPNDFRIKIASTGASGSVSNVTVDLIVDCPAQQWG